MRKVSLDEIAWLLDEIAWSYNGYDQILIEGKYWDPIVPGSGDMAV